MEGGGEVGKEEEPGGVGAADGHLLRSHFLSPRIASG